jgi:hypothetical protein
LTRNWVIDSLNKDSTLTDLTKLDLIYLYSQKVCNNDLGLTLLTCLYSTFEHKNIPFTFGLKIPLSFESNLNFIKRTQNLPSHLFIDQPNVYDKDKLQHFFASAYLYWLIENRYIANLTGILIEIGEDSFIKGGAYDVRDLRSNRLGHLFYELLKIHPDATPSLIFQSWNKEFLGRN